MPAIHEIATLTSKGQVMLPKSVRQLLGLDTGDKIAFDVRAGEVVVSRADTPTQYAGNSLSSLAAGEDCRRFRLFFRYDSTSRISSMPGSTMSRP
jgi:AbrB family looped-hinge helix DNA binding protein